MTFLFTYYIIDIAGGAIDQLIENNSNNDNNKDNKNESEEQ